MPGSALSPSFFYCPKHSSRFDSGGIAAMLAASQHVIAKTMFTPHLIRPAHSLNGLWSFAFLGAIDLGTFDPASCQTSQSLPVPSAFDALPDYAGKRGAAVYQTTFDLPPGFAARIDFGAVSMWCRVYVDNAPLREHRCGYAPFSVTVPPAEHTRRTLTVLVDNRFDAARLPMHEEKFDFYQYGGILRDVTCHVLPAAAPHLERVHVTPLSGYARGEVEVAITFAGTTAANLTAAFQFDDAPAMAYPIARAEGTQRLTLRVPEAQVWSPTTPHLHQLRVTLLAADGQPIDDLAVRFGLRRIEAHDGQLRLNGQPLTLRGYNRHEWHPQYGPCTPTLQMASDLQLLRDLGCNFVRGSHYPQDSRFLDLCDEWGFLVFEENLGWQQSAATMTTDAYRRDHADTLRAMVNHSYNHPSIILRGFLNEAESDQPDSRPLYEESAALLRELDPTRLITYATDRAPRDVNLDLVDVISVNIYPGWYGCEGVENPLSLIAPRMQDIRRAMDEKGFRDKPLLISEIGCEGLYGWHDPHRDFFSEEYQAQYLAEACRQALALERCCGIALWQFCDGRTYGGGRALGRPRTFNNKGTLDEYRRPKLAYAAVREIFKPGKS